MIMKVTKGEEEEEEKVMRNNGTLFEKRKKLLNLKTISSNNRDSPKWTLFSQLDFTFMSTSLVPSFV